MAMFVHTVTPEDFGKLQAIGRAMGMAPDNFYFLRCMQEQHVGSRVMFIAECDGQPAGYVQLIWEPIYTPFRRLGIPEIQDLNVVPEFRRRGVGNLLVEYCEKSAKEAGKTDIGLGVGLHAGFGQAQRLYIRRGYLPDGLGLVHDEEPAPAGSIKPIDDILALKLVKAL